MFFSSSSKSASSLAPWSHRCFVKCANSLILTVFALVLIFVRPRVDGLFGKKKLLLFVLNASLMIDVGVG